MGHRCTPMKKDQPRSHGEHGEEKQIPLPLRVLRGGVGGGEVGVRRPRRRRRLIGMIGGMDMGVSNVERRGGEGARGEGATRRRLGLSSLSPPHLVFHSPTRLCYAAIFGDVGGCWT